MQRLDYPLVGETLWRDTLPNGLRLSVAVKPGYTRCFAAFTTRYGGADRRFRFGGDFIDTPAGVAHFLEHKMFDMPDGESALTVLAQSGAQPNAWTSSGLTSYHFESTENFYENLRMLLRFVSTPYFTEASVAKEQGIIGQEIRMCEDNPDYVIYEELMRCLYDHHPIRDAVAGTVESIAEITPETLCACHRIFYNPGNMTLAVAGDVDPARVRAVAMEVLPAEAGEVPGRDYGAPEGLLPAKPRFSRAMTVSAPQMIVGVKLTPDLTGDALLRQKLLAGLALNVLYGPSSPFYSRLYAEGLLNADFFTDMDAAAGTATLLAGGETRDSERVLSEMIATAENAAKNGLDAAFFTRCQRAAYGARVRALSSFPGLCASLSDADFGGYCALDAFAASAALTAEDLRAFIAENLTADRFAMSVITPLGSAPGDPPSPLGSPGAVERSETERASSAASPVGAGVPDGPFAGVPDGPLAKEATADA